MDDSQKCLKCGGADLRPGKIVDFLTRPYFLPEDGLRRGVRRAPLELNAVICLICGFAEISVDPEGVKASLKTTDTD